jgi:co-chaperonin GroES (HSP10)
MAQFPTKAYGDNIIIRRLAIKDVMQKRAEKGKFTIPETQPPKNLLDIEKRKMEENLQYENVETELIKKWDEHPNQAIVMAVGPGRDVGGGVLLVPQVKPGQHILYRGKAGDPLIINKQLYWVIKDYDIFSTVPAAELIK